MRKEPIPRTSSRSMPAKAETLAPDKYSPEVLSNLPLIASSLDSQTRYAILIKEMKLLQGRFDKYDDLIFRIRAWLMAAIGVLLVGALDKGKKEWALYALGVTALFYGNEVLWRSQHWYKFVRRYRFVRDCLNTNQPVERVSLYDLTLKYNAPRLQGMVRLKRWILSCLLKKETVLFYMSLIAASLMVYRLVVPL